LYPHERSLVKRLANKPFALLGVNSDEDRQQLKTVMEQENITWRSWWNGGSTDGPISTKWQIGSWPTILVLDTKGIIRHIDTGGADVDIEVIEEVVDSLLKELAEKS